MNIDIILNDQPHCFAISPRDTLLDVIREKANLKGTKRGCDGGHCGACTVIMDGEIVNSCCIMAFQADGKRIMTIEYLSQSGEPDPIQEAFVEQNAVQCGFCIPGMVLATKSLLDRVPHPDDAEIKEGLAGNFCRCTGYEKIENAVRSAAEKREGAK